MPLQGQRFFEDQLLHAQSPLDSGDDTEGELLRQIYMRSLFRPNHRCSAILVYALGVQFAPL